MFIEEHVNAIKDLSTESIKEIVKELQDLLEQRSLLAVAQKQVSVEPEVKPANGERNLILREVRHAIDEYLLDVNTCNYIEGIEAKNNLHLASLLLIDIKNKILSRLSV